MDEMLRNREAGRELSQYGGGNGQWERYKWKSCFKDIIPCVKPVYEGPQDDGCTACVALIRGNIIVVGNAGDSRCIISRNGQAMDLSTDHKPHLQAETQRIENAGHEVTRFPQRGGISRVDNGIAISRSIGDVRYKDNANLPPQQQALTSFPDVRTEVITNDTGFLFMACDGIWDCMSSQDVVNFVRVHPSEVYQPVAICEALLDHCLKLPGGKDNMAALLVRFKRPVQPLIQASAAKSGTGTGQSSSRTGGGGSGSNRLSKSSEL
ncbi:hypothetical protein EJB05_39062 [Eragrostis curvula]|uniref:protein-serine/threonine phosphatase n=1 Tax=Eragrostis curvula TaxID=38414 RepID=A0A5J9TWH4_9POAL|nr:hypothetical protein EJB05_39062 [Eragrostis curvula]